MEKSGENNPIWKLKIVLHLAEWSVIDNPIKIEGHLIYAGIGEINNPIKLTFSVVKHER